MNFAQHIANMRSLSGGLSLDKAISECGTVYLLLVAYGVAGLSKVSRECSAAHI